MGGNSDDRQSTKVLRLGKIFRLLRFFKLLRLFKLGRIMKRLKQALQVNPTVLMLLKTLTSMGAILHWTACIYWFIVDTEGDSVRDKLGEADYWHPPQYIIEDRIFGDQYAYSFFWALSVTIGVGWDIIPGTQMQVVFSSLMIIIGSMWYITIIGTVTSICVNATAMRAFDDGYAVTILSDCTSGRTTIEQDFFCKEVFPLFADVCDHTTFLSRLGVPA